MQKIHEYGGFRLNINELSKLFYIIYNYPHLKNKELEEESGFGKNKIENLKYYLRHINLLDGNYSPTQLSNVIYSYDKYFEDYTTLWVLFYHWSQKNSNPFLYYLLNESQSAMSKDELHRDFTSWALSNKIKIDYEKKDFISGLISRTLNSFSEQDAFKGLSIIIYQDDKYKRDTPYKLNPLIVAYILYENRQGRTTISFEELLNDNGNIGKVFNLNRETLQNQIYLMRDFNLVQYVQTANLQYVTYTHNESPLKILESYYEQHQ